MSIISWDVTEADEHLHDRWLQGFCIQVPDKEIRKQLEQIIKQQYQEKGWKIPQRQTSCRCLSFFRRKLSIEIRRKRLRREVIANVSISIHELLAVAREAEGVKAVQGDAMLCEKTVCTGYPVYGGVFGVGADGAVWRRGNISSLLFNKESILRNGGVTEPRNLSFSKTGACFGRNTALSSSPNIFSRLEVGKKQAGKKRMSAGARLRGQGLFHRKLNIE